MPDIITDNPVRDAVRSLEEVRQALQLFNLRLESLRDAVNMLGDVTVDGAATVKGYVTLTDAQGNDIKLMVAN
jgi:hypothetical protein